MSFEHGTQTGDYVFILKNAILGIEEFKPKIKGSSFWIRLPLYQPYRPKEIPQPRWFRISPSSLHNNPLFSDDDKVRIRFNPGVVLVPFLTAYYLIPDYYRVISSKSIGINSYDLTTFTKYERNIPVLEGSLQLVELTLNREDILGDEDEDESSRANFYESSSELSELSVESTSLSVDSSTMVEQDSRVKIVKWSNHYLTELEGLLPPATTIIMDQADRTLILPYDDYSGRIVHIKNLSSGLIRIKGVIDLVRQTLEIKPKSARTLQFDDRNWYVISQYDH